MDHTVLIEHSKHALLATYDVFTSLGANGIETVHTNQFGDTAMRGDVSCEEAVIAYFQQHQVPVRILSEEHGITDITEHPIYLAVLDGIDGSVCYKNFFMGDTDARFGTLLTVFASLDPLYSDYVCAGSLDHATAQLFFCSRGHGAYVESLSTQIKTPIHTSSTDTFAPSNRIYTDSNPMAAHLSVITEQFVSPLSGFTLTCLFSSARYYVDLACGDADLVLECTRKGNLEIAFGYAISREAGGVMLDIQGNDLGPRPFLRFGQDSSLPTIAASTYVLAKECINYLTEQRARLGLA